MRFLRALWYMAWTLIIYLGVTLLGWGLRDLGGYFTDTSRVRYVAVVVLFSLAVGFQAFYNPEGINGGRGEKAKFVFRQRILAYVLVYSMFLALFLLPYFEHRGIGIFSSPELLRYLGVILSACGYALIFLSGLTLGRQYSADVTIQKDHQLITSGIYKYLRHPRYLGVIALAVGVPLVFRSWIGLIASIFFTWLIYLRIQDEENTMQKEFGVQWEAYRQRSWRLLPYVY